MRICVLSYLVWPYVTKKEEKCSSRVSVSMCLKPVFPRRSRRQCRVWWVSHPIGLVHFLERLERVIRHGKCVLRTLPLHKMLRKCVPHPSQPTTHPPFFFSVWNQSISPPSSSCLGWRWRWWWARWHKQTHYATSHQHNIARNACLSSPRSSVIT